MAAPGPSRIEVDKAFRLLRGEGQPAAFVELAARIAASPDWLREVILSALSGAAAPWTAPDECAIREWLAMYRRHRLMQDDLAAGVAPPSEFGASEVLDGCRELSRMDREDVAAEVAELPEEVLQELLRSLVGTPFPPDVRTLRAMFEGFEAEAEVDDADDEARFDSMVASPAGQFYFRVWLPCWVLHREYPQRLLRAARCGDIDALERLLRIDKFVLADQRVAPHVARVMSEGPKVKRDQLLAALSGKPRERLTPKAVRSGLSALISQLAFLFRSSVTATEIAALFDGIEQVRTGEVDVELPVAENLTRAIHRNRNWPSLPTQKPGQ